MTAEPFTYHAECPRAGCGSEATWHASPAGGLQGLDTLRVDCPGCGTDPEPDPEPAVPLARYGYAGPIGAMIAATARRVLP